MTWLIHAQEMFLQFGPDPRWAGAFGSEGECRAAWMRERDELLAGYPPGRRPQAWWHFDAGELGFPGLDREQSALWEAKVLSEEERAALVRGWRREFERAQAPDFWLSGSGRILRGAAARRAHYRWADIPRDLLKRWTRERRRQRKMIRKLETAAAESPAA
jgi:hypothetical protein